MGIPLRKFRIEVTCVCEDLLLLLGSCLIHTIIGGARLRTFLSDQASPALSHGIPL